MELEFEKEFSMLTDFPPMRRLFDLRSLWAFNGIPLALSTLRGELADNEEWKADPARAATLVGTIDMIGSKLLFSGYGNGAYNRVHHAGLIVGQDDGNGGKAKADISIYGQESNYKTWRLAKMNLAITGTRSVVRGGIK